MMPKSLSIRLLVIFVIGFVLLISLLRIGVGYSLKREMDVLQAGSVLRFTRIILDRGSGQVNFSRAARMAARAGMLIHIQTHDRQWSSEGDFIDVQHLRFTRIGLPHHFGRHSDRTALPGLGRPVKPIVEVARSWQRIYKIRTENATFFYEVPNRHRRLGWYFWLIGLSFIAVMYCAIRYLFSPVADIKRVVQQVSQGNFKARTTTRRQDELGELAAQVDNMVVDIDHLLESKRSLLLGISHELRTPLTRAKVALAMLESGKYRDNISEDMQEIDNIITELTEAEKLSSHAIISRQVVDLNLLVKEVLSEWFAESDVDFTPLAAQTYVNIDPMRIRLLLKNLLKNALQHTPDGRAAPHISLCINNSEQGHYLDISVIDQGYGIAPADVNKITEPFYRADPSRQRATGGSGLGLYLCNVIAMAHGGKLQISSELNQGTQVIASIALGAPDQT